MKGQDDEVPSMTNAQNQAWQLALARLQEAARKRQAHGVLDVRLTRRHLGPNVEEVMAQGTAIVLDRPPLPPTPFLCSLTSQEFWTLRRGGYRPVGLAVGACTRYFTPGYYTRDILRRANSILGRMPTLELDDLTRVFAAARDTALARLITSVRGGLAEGVIGLSLKEMQKDYQQDNRRTLLVSVTAMGTAITPHRDRWTVLDYALSLDG